MDDSHPVDPFGSLPPDPEMLEESRSDQNQSHIELNEMNPEVSAVNRDSEDETTQDGAPAESVFWFKATYCRKLFRSQLRPGQICTKDVIGNSLEGVLCCIWRTAKHQVHRKVVFNDEIPTWSEEEQSGFEDIDQFIMLQDQRKKKLYSVSSITPPGTSNMAWKRNQDLHLRVLIECGDKLPASETTTNIDFSSKP